MEALQRQVKELKAMGVDKIVALGHSGFDVDRDVARRVGRVDVVIGGHSNTFLYTGRQGPSSSHSSSSSSFSSLSSSYLSSCFSSYSSILLLFLPLLLLFPLISLL